MDIVRSVRLIPTVELVTIIVPPGYGQVWVWNEPWLLLVLHLQGMQQWATGASGRMRVVLVVVVVVVVAADVAAVASATGS